MFATDNQTEVSLCPPAHDNVFFFFLLVLIRGIGPGSDSYHKDDLINHLSEFQGTIFDIEKDYLGNTFDNILADGDERIITKDNIFTELIPKVFVESRRISLGAMKEGLTLNGMFKTASVLLF